MIFSIVPEGNAIPECSEELLVRFWKNVPEREVAGHVSMKSGSTWEGDDGELVFFPVLDGNQRCGSIL
jgi:hypothetical protein